MNLSKSMIGLSAVVWFSGASLADIADFYTLDSTGEIYLVDGATLEASFVIDIAGQDGRFFNEILYLSDGGILVNNGVELIRYDVASGEERIVFDAGDSIDQNSLTMGLGATQDGNVFMTVTSFPGQGKVDWYGATFDPFTGAFDRLADIDPISGLYFDHHQIGDHLFLGADWSGGRISVIDSLSGETIFYDVGFDPVSFFESNDLLFTLTRSGDIYTFDALTGESELYGAVGGGTSGNWIGAASTSAPFILPAPSSLALFGLMGIAATRRRR